MLGPRERRGCHERDLGREVRVLRVASPAVGLLRILPTPRHEPDRPFLPTGPTGALPERCPRGQAHPTPRVTRTSRRPPQPTPPCPRLSETLDDHGWVEQFLGDACSDLQPSSGVAQGPDD